MLPLWLLWLVQAPPPPSIVQEWIDLGIYGVLALFLWAMFTGQIRLKREVEAAEKRIQELQEATDKRIHDLDTLWRERYAERTRDGDEWKTVAQRKFEVVEATLETLKETIREVTHSQRDS